MHCSISEKREKIFIIRISADFFSTQTPFRRVISEDLSFHISATVSDEKMVCVMNVCAEMCARASLPYHCQWLLRRACSIAM